MCPLVLSIQTSLAGPLTWWSQLPAVELNDDRPEWILSDHGGKLTLYRYTQPSQVLTVDWLAGAVAHRAHPGRVLHEDLIKAVGVFKGYTHVWDWTLGLGKDTWMLANAGCRVEAYERHPILYQLVYDAWRRAAAHPACQQVTLHFGEPVRDRLLTPDVVYFDPMFPERNKSAKVKGGMQILQSLLGHGQDAEVWLERAFCSGARRVVVKRPARAESISCSRKPSHQISGKSSRFDVYQLK